jgi:hypothetical protein
MGFEAPASCDEHEGLTAVRGSDLPGAGAGDGRGVVVLSPQPVGEGEVDAGIAGDVLRDDEGRAARYGHVESLVDER